MTRTVRPLPGTRSRGTALEPHQRNSHRGLIDDRSRLACDHRVGKVETIIVPSGRRADPSLRAVAKLAAAAEIQLIVLASRQCTVDEAAEVIAQTPGCRGLVVEVPVGYTHPLFDFETSSERFTRLSSDRDSDLSVKRNIGLCLGQMVGWEKVMFLDDDIIDVTPYSLAKVATQLERYQVTGLVSMQFPDNSVVCHANRLSGERQGSFITGAALGVNLAAEPLDFFPNIYNEDWLAFASRAEAGEIVSVGMARQEEFNPFEDPARAAREEFGDVIAEGLYSLFSDGCRLQHATSAFWAAFVESRASLIRSIRAKVEPNQTNESNQATASLDRAEEQLALIGTDDCVDFVRAWRQDRGAFARRAHHLPIGLSLSDALDHLELPNFRQPEFGLRHGITGMKAGLVLGGTRARSGV